MKKISIFMAVVIVLSIIIAGCGGDATTTTTTTTAASEGAKAGDKVAVDYVGTLEDSTEFDSSRDRGPLEFTVGAGQMIAGFDAAVVGMKVGDTKTVTLPPEQAYGLHRDDLLLRFTEDQLPEGITYTVGQKVPLQLSGGGTTYGTVTEVKAGYIVVDANHELAGKTLIFEITMVSITPAAANP